MSINIEQASCFGRGFTGNGMLQNFQNWIERPPVATPIPKSSGGPGWYIIEDQSLAPINNEYYIVVSNHDAATIANNPNAYGDSAHKILKIGYNLLEAAQIRVRQYLWWDTSVNPGVGYHEVVGPSGTDSAIGTVDADFFVYDFRGGHDFLSIGTRRGTTWDFFILDNFVSDGRLLEPLTKFGVLTAGVTAGTDVVLTLNGQASNFTVGKYYYIFDINASGAKHDWLNYVKVTDVNPPNQITVDILRYDFPTGSVIHPYPHRFYTLYSSSVGGGTSTLILPYASVKSSGTDWQNILSRSYSGAIFDFEVNIVARNSPDCENNFVSQSPWLVEQQENRAYGSLENVSVSSNNQVSQMLDGRLINTKRYVYASNYFSNAINFAVLLPDFNIV